MKTPKFRLPSIARSTLFSAIVAAHAALLHNLELPAPRSSSLSASSAHRDADLLPEETRADADPRAFPPIAPELVSVEVSPMEPPVIELFVEAGKTP